MFQRDVYENSRKRDVQHLRAVRYGLTDLPMDVLYLAPCTWCVLDEVSAPGACGAYDKVKSETVGVKVELH